MTSIVLQRTIIALLLIFCIISTASALCSNDADCMALNPLSSCNTNSACVVSVTIAKSDKVCALFGSEKYTFSIESNSPQHVHTFTYPVTEIAPEATFDNILLYIQDQQDTTPGICTDAASFTSSDISLLPSECNTECGGSPQCPCNIVASVTIAVGTTKDALQTHINAECPTSIQVRYALPSQGIAVLTDIPTTKSTLSETKAEIVASFPDCFTGVLTNFQDTTPQCLSACGTADCLCELGQACSLGSSCLESTCLDSNGVVATLTGVCRKKVDRSVTITVGTTKDALQTHINAECPTSIQVRYALPSQGIAVLTNVPTTKSALSETKAEIVSSFPDCFTGVLTNFQDTTPQCLSACGTVGCPCELGQACSLGSSCLESTCLDSNGVVATLTGVCRNKVDRSVTIVVGTTKNTLQTHISAECPTSIQVKYALPSQGIAVLTNVPTTKSALSETKAEIVASFPDCFTGVLTNFRDTTPQCLSACGTAGCLCELDQPCTADTSCTSEHLCRDSVCKPKVSNILYKIFYPTSVTPPVDTVFEATGACDGVLSLITNVKGDNTGNVYRIVNLISGVDDIVADKKRIEANAACANALKLTTTGVLFTKPVSSCRSTCGSGDCKCDLNSTCSSNQNCFSNLCEDVCIESIPFLFKLATTATAATVYPHIQTHCQSLGTVAFKYMVGGQYLGVMRRLEDANDDQLWASLKQNFPTCFGAAIFDVTTTPTRFASAQGMLVCVAATTCGAHSDCQCAIGDVCDSHLQCSSDFTTTRCQFAATVPTCTTTSTEPITLRINYPTAQQSSVDTFFSQTPSVTTCNSYLLPKYNLQKRAVYVSYHPMALPADTPNYTADRFRAEIGSPCAQTFGSGATWLIVEADDSCSIRCGMGENCLCGQNEPCTIDSTHGCVYPFVCKLPDSDDSSQIPETEEAICQQPERAAAKQVRYLRIPNITDFARLHNALNSRSCRQSTLERLYTLKYRGYAHVKIESTWFTVEDILENEVSDACHHEIAQSVEDINDIQTVDGASPCAKECGAEECYCDFGNSCRTSAQCIWDATNPQAQLFCSSLTSTCSTYVPFTYSFDPSTFDADATRAKLAEQTECGATSTDLSKRGISVRYVLPHAGRMELAVPLPASNLLSDVWKTLPTICKALFSQSNFNVNINANCYVRPGGAYECLSEAGQSCDPTGTIATDGIKRLCNPSLGLFCQAQDPIDGVPQFGVCTTPVKPDEIMQVQPLQWTIAFRTIADSTTASGLGTVLPNNSQESLAIANMLFCPTFDPSCLITDVSTVNRMNPCSADTHFVDPFNPSSGNIWLGLMQEFLYYIPAQSLAVFSYKSSLPLYTSMGTKGGEFDFSSYTAVNFPTTWAQVQAEIMSTAMKFSSSTFNTLLTNPALCLQGLGLGLGLPTFDFTGLTVCSKHCGYDPMFGPTTQPCLCSSNQGCRSNQDCVNDPFIARLTCQTNPLYNPAINPFDPNPMTCQPAPSEDPGTVAVLYDIKIPFSVSYEQALSILNGGETSSATGGGEEEEFNMLNTIKSVHGEGEQDEEESSFIIDIAAQQSYRFSHSVPSIEEQMEQIRQEKMMPIYNQLFGVQDDKVEPFMDVQQVNVPPCFVRKLVDGTTNRYVSVPIFSKINYVLPQSKIISLTVQTKRTLDTPTSINAFFNELSATCLQSLQVNTPQLAVFANTDSCRNVCGSSECKCELSSSCTFDQDCTTGLVCSLDTSTGASRKCQPPAIPPAVIDPTRPSAIEDYKFLRIEYTFPNIKSTFPIQDIMPLLDQAFGSCFIYKSHFITSKDGTTGVMVGASTRQLIEADPVRCTSASLTLDEKTKRSTALIKDKILVTNINSDISYDFAKCATLNPLSQKISTLKCGEGCDANPCVIQKDVQCTADNQCQWGTCTYTTSSPNAKVCANAFTSNMSFFIFAILTIVIAALF